MKLFLAFIYAILFFTQAASSSEIQVGFNKTQLQDWQEKSFAGHTKYQLAEDNKQTIVQATTNASASGLFKEIDIDLNKTPYLNWRWKVENTYKNINEQTKQGDDYPARLYIVVSGGVFFWKTKAINYVWSSAEPIATTWNNAYTNNAKMMSLRSGDNGLGQWKTEKRNIKADFELLFGKDINNINAIALMSDSDNSKQSATAFYSNIYFSAE